MISTGTEQLYIYIVIMVIGMIFGSFLYCAASRTAAGKSFIRGRSICDNCGHVLSGIDLIPVITYIITKGKCRYCGTKVSLLYPITEVLFALIAISCYMQFGSSAEGIRVFLLSCDLFYLSVTDFKAYLIPDHCQIAAIILWISAIGKNQYVSWNNLLSGLLFAGIMTVIAALFDRILKKDSMGGGDIKLIGIIGLYLGGFGGMLTLMLACVMGIIIGMVRSRVMKYEDAQIPFGPALASAFWLILLYGRPLIDWYVRLLY